MIHTQDQTNAIEMAREFLLSDERVMIIDGYAGTGKTEVIKQILKQLEAINALNTAIGENPLDPVLAATTIKSKDLLAENLNKKVNTFQSNYMRTMVKLSKLLIIDEYSYIPKHEYNIFLKTLIDDGSKIILVGDSLQLEPPHGKPSDYKDVKYKAKLTTPVRQQAESELGKYVAQLRDCITTLSGAPPIPFNTTDLIHLPRDEWIKRMGHTPTVAFTNLDAVTIDDEWHKFTYGKLAKDQIVVHHPSLQSMRIHNLKETANGYVIRTGISGNFVIPKSLQERADMFKQQSGALNHLQLGHTMTIHKAQGSTYENIFVDLTSISKCPNALTKLKLLYVAMSRAKHAVYFTGEFT